MTLFSVEGYQIFLTYPPFTFNNFKTTVSQKQLSNVQLINSTVLSRSFKISCHQGKQKHWFTTETPNPPLGSRVDNFDGKFG